MKYLNTTDCSLFFAEEVKVYDEICPYRVARRVRHGVVFFTDIQGTVV